MSRVIYRDLVVYLPARVVPALLMLIAIPIFTRALPPAEYGNYLLAFSSLTLIGSLSAAWLGSVVVRFLPVTGAPSLARTCMPLVLTSAMTGLLLWIGTASLQGSPFDGWIYLTCGGLWILSFGGFEYLAAWLRAQNRPLAYGLALSWRSLGTLLVSLVLLRWGFSQGAAIILGAAIAMVVALVLLPGLVFGQARSTDKTNGSKPAEVNSLLRFGLPAALSNLGIAGLSFADRFVVEEFLGPGALAVYGASYDIAEKTIFLLNAMLLLSSTVMAVKVFEHDGEKAALRLLSDLLRIYLVAATILATLVGALAPEVVAVLLPPAYGAGAIVLPMVAGAAVLVGILHRYSIVLSLHKRTDILMWCTFAALTVKIVAAIALVPPLGLAGSGISTLLGYGSWLLFVRIAITRHRSPRFPWVTLVRVAIASLIAGLVMRIVVLPTIFGLALALTTGVVVYVVALVALREIRMQGIREGASAIRAGFGGS